jgi:TonB family protein
MRTLAALFLIAAAPALFGTTTLEVRSAMHAMTIDVEGEDDTREYAVRVTDQESGELLLNQLLEGSKAQARLAVDDGRVLQVQVEDIGIAIVAKLLVQVNGQTIDSIETRWFTHNRSGIVPVPTVEAPPPPDGPVRVGGSVRAPVLISRVEPQFTEAARKAHISGIVIVEVIIDRRGEVREAKVLKPLPFGLDQAALDAVKQWKFRPGTLEGTPVDVIFNLTVNFRPSEDEPQ